MNSATPLQIISIVKLQCNLFCGVLFLRLFNPNRAVALVKEFNTAGVHQSPGI